MEECVHCYAGEILEVEEQVREVKRKSLKRNDTLSFSFFSWPTKDDIGWHDRMTFS